MRLTDWEISYSKKDGRMNGKIEKESKLKTERPANVVHHHKGKSSHGVLNKEAILKALKILPGQTVIDAGCGNGYMAKEFSKLLQGTGRVYALDVDKESIETLKKETGRTNIEPIVADITETVPIGDCSADLIYMSNVLHGFSESQIENFQKEVKRLLKPNAVLAIVEIKKENTPFGPPLNIRFSPEQLRQKITLPAEALVEAGQYSYMQIFKNTDRNRPA
jgi:ubiquinone/menaquinone biosynthesis C-methylase UbiE